MIAEWRVLLRAGVAATAIAALSATGCAPAASGGSADSEADEQITMARNLRNAERALREVFDEFGTMGLTPLVGTADFVPCEGNRPGAVAPAVTGQLRYEDGRSSTEAGANQLGDALVTLGQGVTGVAPSEASVTSTPDGWGIALFGYQFADIEVRVRLHSDAPEVDVSVTGECVPATAEEQEFYDAMGTWYLNALVPRTPTTTDH